MVQKKFELIQNWARHEPVAFLFDLHPGFGMPEFSDSSDDQQLIAAMNAGHLEAFDVLYQLYHLTVTDVSKSPTVPITIAK